MCLQALSALAMTRMYYDGSMDDRSALVEEQRILDKSQGFLKKRQVLAAPRGTPSRGWSPRRLVLRFLEPAGGRGRAQREQERQRCRADSDG